MNTEIENRFATAHNIKDPRKRAEAFADARRYMQAHPAEATVTHAPPNAIQKSLNVGPTWLRIFGGRKSSSRPTPIYTRDEIMAKAEVISSKARIGQVQIEIEPPIVDATSPNNYRFTPEQKLIRLLKSIPEAAARLVQRGKKSIEDRITALRELLSDAN